MKWIFRDKRRMQGQRDEKRRIEMRMRDRGEVRSFVTIWVVVVGFFSFRFDS